jgi:hypothetical protein
MTPCDLGKQKQWIPLVNAARFKRKDGVGQFLPTRFRLGLRFCRLIRFWWNKEAARRRGGLLGLLLFLCFFVTPQLTFGHDLSPRTFVHSTLLGLPLHACSRNILGVEQAPARRDDRPSSGCAQNFFDASLTNYNFCGSGIGSTVGGGRFTELPPKISSAMGDLNDGG